MKKLFWSGTASLGQQRIKVTTFSSNGGKSGHIFNLIELSVRLKMERGSQQKRKMVTIETKSLHVL